MLAVSAVSWSRFLGVESRVGDVSGGRRISSRRGLRFRFAVAMASSIFQHSPWAFRSAWKQVRLQRTAPPRSDPRYPPCLTLHDADSERRELRRSMATR
jgi:hypothetical protein